MVAMKISSKGRSHSPWRQAKKNKAAPDGPEITKTAESAKTALVTKVTQDPTQDAADDESQDKTQEVTQDEEVGTVHSSKSRNQRRHKSKKSKFLLDDSGINEISDELLGKTFQDVVINTTKSFQALASFRTSEFQEMSKEMGEDLGEVGAELIATTKSFIDQDHFTVVTSNEKMKKKKDDVRESREDEDASLTDSSGENRVGADGAAEPGSLCTDDETGTLLSEDVTGSIGFDDATFEGEDTLEGGETTLTAHSELDFGAILGDDGNHFKFLFGTFAQCLDTANCFNTNMVDDDDVESEFVEKKKVDWRKNLKGIDWRQIAQEAEIEAYGAATEASTCSKKEKKWKKLFNRKRK